MTISPSVETTSTQEHEIIFPQGDFWSDEPPLETYLPIPFDGIMIKIV